jgi:hypothetical protein
MLKIAQKRNLRDRFTVSPAGALKKVFNPQFTEIFSHLEKVDNAARAILTGEEIDGVHPGYEHEGVNCKDLLKSAKTNINRREYMSAIADLARFHKKLADAIEILNQFSDFAESRMEGVHKEFLFKDLPDDRYKHISEFEKRLKAYDVNELMIKESGIADIWHNVVNDRGRALAAWEKKYPKKTAYIKNKIKNMLSKSESTFNFVLNMFRKMTVARAKSNVNDYIQTIANVKNNYNSYHEEWKKNYNGSDPEKDPGLKSVFDQMHGYVDSKAGKKDMGEPIVEKLEDIKHPNLPELEVPKGQPFAPTLPDVEETQIKEKTLPEIPSLEVPVIKPKLESLPKTIKKIKPPVPPTPPPTPSTPTAMPKTEKKSSHDNFIQSLEALSNESPLIMKLYIKKYAERISETDPSMAKKLFDIVNNIKVS